MGDDWCFGTDPDSDAVCGLREHDDTVEHRGRDSAGDDREWWGDDD